MVAGVSFLREDWSRRRVRGLPDVAVDDQVLLLEALGQLELVIVHQCRVRDDNQWGADAQYLTDRSGA